jgi:MFS family permease
MRRFASVFVASFFLSLHFGAVLYVNSSLLGNFFRPSAVSLLFFLSATGTTLLFLFAPRLIEHFGKRLLLAFFFILAFINILVLGFATTATAVALSFVIYASLVPMIYYFLDIFIEELSKDDKTGEIRGIYLSLFNTGLAFGPLVLAILSQGSSLKLVYIFAGMLLMIPILLSIFSFKSKNPKWHSFHHHNSLLPFKIWWRTKSLRRITLARFVLEFFFAFMVIYTPLYLHGVLGFQWNVLGIMFAVMLLPFILLQWPIGELADRFVGEKEFMIIGFIIMGASLLFMPSLPASAMIWTLTLFASRIGASMVEVTTESYFFKHINASDTGLISIFRLTRPISIALGSLIGAVALNFFSFEKIFFVLAIVIFFGLKESLSIRDTL